jgi:hypothetical protein
MKKLLLLIMAVVLVGCVSQESVSQEKVNILIHTTPLGVAPNIYIDGKLIGKADFNHLYIHLKPGAHQVRAVKPGVTDGGERWEDAEITIHVQPKDKASVQSANNRGVQQAFQIHQKRIE